jgi:hypothetical protein
LTSSTRGACTSLRPERQQLPRERRRAIGGVRDVLHLLRLRSACIDLEQHVAADVMTVSRLLKSWATAAGQPAHGLHLLRLAQLLLELAARSVMSMMLPRISTRSADPAA